MLCARPKYHNGSEEYEEIRDKGIAPLKGEGATQ